jgi:hypothetical protein
MDSETCLLIYLLGQAGFLPSWQVAMNKNTVALT